jgi:hypothetical protein
LAEAEEGSNSGAEVLMDGERKEELKGGFRNT